MAPTAQLRFGLIGFLIGVIISLKIALLLSCLGLVVSGVLYGIYRSKCFLGLCILFCGTLYANGYNALFYLSNLDHLVGETVVIKAQVLGESRLSRTGVQTVRLNLQAYQHGNGVWKPQSGLILWQGAPRPRLKAGDKLVLKATVSRLVSFSPDFDLSAYWSRWGVSHAIIRVQVIERPPNVPAAQNRWREFAQTRLKTHLQKPHSTIALGMLIGLKEKLPPALENDFKKAGLQHLLVVSGTNVTLLLFAVGLLLKPLGPWLKYGLGILVLGLYLVLVGFDPPALRASLFGALIGFAVTSGFNVEFRNLLLVCATIMTLFDPRFLTHDISFWLSFAATAGIFFGVPLLNQWLKFIKYKYLRLLLAASMAAQVAVFPILIILFGSFPYGGLLSNLVTEPLVPTIMLLGASAILIGDIAFLGVSVLLSQALEMAISLLITVAQTTALLPEIIIPIWFGYLLALILVLGSLWASFSAYYQIHYWEPFETDMRG